MSSVADTLITVFTLDDARYSAGAKRVTHNTHKMADAIAVATGAGGGGGGFGGLGSSMKIALAELDASIPVLTEVVSVLKFAALATAGFATAILGFSGYAMKVAADIQALELALRQYATSTEDAERTLRRLVEVAKLPGLGLPEAMQASTRLQAVGFDARLAERAILAFGNALAASGGGKEELDGVILALTQIASKGKISAEEINQIAERVPQIRKILMDAFGTANTESLQKMGISSQDMIVRIIDELEKLAKVSGGWKNSFANIGDVWTRVVSQIGAALNTVLVPALDKVSVFIENMATGGVFSRIATELIGAASSVTFIADGLKIISEIGSSKGISALTDVFKFIAGGSDLGDTLMRVVSVIVAAVAFIPQIIKAAVQILNSQMENIKNFINQIIDVVNNILKRLAEGVELDFGMFGKHKIVEGVKAGPLPKIGSGQGVDWSPLQGPLQGIAGEADALYNKYKNMKGSTEVADDTSKGGFRPGYNVMEEIAKNTKEISVNTRSIDRTVHILGGGDIGRYGTSAIEDNQIKSGGRQGGGGSSAEGMIDEGLRLIKAAIFQMGGNTGQATNRLLRS